MLSLELLDLTLPTPEENLACDEALLDELEDGLRGPTLRFWEPTRHFVVVGYGNKIASEVNIAACQRLNIPILRRSSGGGTVVQGPGCLNYNLTLPISGETAGITETNCHVMRRHRDALTELVEREVEIQGHTDLTVEGLKFSGNAQRRRAKSLMFHGCFLIDFDLPLIGEVLLHPSKEPDYRAKRGHRDFLFNLKIPAEKIKAWLAGTWHAENPARPPSGDCIHALISERFGNPAWNEKL